MQADAVILGGGAAGLFCAGEAARRGRKVIVIEHRPTAGEKIRISGGGRCNFTNFSTAPERFLSQNPRFAISALRRFTPQDFVARVDRAGIAWHEKALGQLFCDGSSVQIIRMLTDGLAGAELWCGTSFGDISKRDEGFLVETSRGTVRTGRVVVATGGKSVPKIGATAEGYRIAERFGLKVTETRPALVPMTFAEQELAWLAPLAGIAVDGRVAAGRQAFDDALLFTHRGLSGPAVLQASSYWREGQPVTVDLARGQDAFAALKAAKARAGRSSVATALAELLPTRLAQTLAVRAGLTGHLAEQPDSALRKLADAVHRLSLRPVGTEGYRTAEVTLGGVDTDELDPRTMEAKRCPGLHFIGEVVDVTGWLGGYNFQWAWSSAWIAGQVI
jgi:predicted Rossmann fold flavoprotein